LSQIILPNARFLGMTSHHSGRDWDELIPQIDELMDEIGLSLAEETIILIFSESDESAIEGTSECKVCRPVVGPKKQVPGLFFMEDWVQKTVFSFPIKSEGWEEVFLECSKIRDQLILDNKKIKNGPMLLLKRELSPDLKLTVEAVFQE